MKKIHLHTLILLPAFILLMVVVSACLGNKSGQKDAAFVKQEGLVWNTSFHVTFRGPDALKDSIIAVLDKIGKEFSIFDTTSLVSRVNMNDSTPVDTDFIRLYVASRRVNKVTDGVFDPTLSPLISAWGFGPGHKISADTARIDSILQFVGIDKTRISRDALIKDDPRISFNFSAIAKGFGCDCVGEMLKRNGVSDYLIEIGGEIAMAGKSPSGSDWKVSIDKPILSADKEIHISQAIIELTDAGVATSGNYRNFIENDSIVYGHTISAETGRPVQTDVISATVIAPTAMEADAFATSFMAMDSEKAMNLATSLRLPMMLVLTDSTVTTNKLFDKLLIPQD